MTDRDESRKSYTLRSLLLYFLRLGTTGFGGPVALIGYMNRDLVLERKWFTPEEFARGFAFSQLAPGPLAAQLAMYLGFVRARVLGATLVSIAFIAPSFLMVVGLGAIYVAYGSLSWIAAAFYGIGPAVIAIIVRSSWKLTKTTLAKDYLLWAIFAAAFAVTLWLGETQLWTFAAGGVIMLGGSYFVSRGTLNRPWLKGRNGQQGLKVVVFPALFMQVGLVSGNRSLVDILWFFLKSGFIVFGSGLAIVPFLHGDVVNGFHWLTERQFLDAVAVAMITPGPVVITVAFIGYLVHGFSGAGAAALGVFLPVYLFVVFLAPVFERFSDNPHLRAFVKGVTAVATGAIATAILILARSAIVDVPTAIVLVVSASLLWLATRSDRRFIYAEPLLIALAACAGLLIKL